AVYRRPKDAWGMRVWRRPLPDEVVERSLAAYDSFYRRMNELLSGKERQHDLFVVLDIHSYNHRRGGPEAPPAEPAENPEVNVGTGTMVDPDHWRPLIDRFITDLHDFDYDGRHLDVRENVSFQGGYFP
ncbi:MAG: N-formylglutamate amidohydrolase, partial [Pseudomonadales bacterium]|nr:N-formylglutamate amidohydrolase [Pseudomonadales bacterium]NIX09777.1 N-formylglutamate amidohydrolase [Pseudomonadales bacterium]